MARSTLSVDIVGDVMHRGVMRMLAGSMALLMFLAGCGQSSGGKSTRSSAGVSTQVPMPAHTVPHPSPPSSANSAGTVTGSAGGVTATMHAGTHHPRVQRPWPIRFTVTKGHRAARASVSYEYLVGNQVVAHRSHYTFTGHFSDVFKWPSSAVGYPLTFRAVIVSGPNTINLDYKVQVST